MESVNQIVREVQAYVPGYSLRVPPIVDGNKVTVIVQVEGWRFSAQILRKPRYHQRCCGGRRGKVAARMRKEGK